MFSGVMISVGILGFCSESEEIHNEFCRLNKNATINTYYLQTLFAWFACKAFVE
jgi:hypothetical protein